MKASFSLISRRCMGETLFSPPTRAKNHSMTAAARCLHASVSARAVRRSTGSYGVVSERGQISYALPKPALTSKGVFTYQVHLVASLTEARAQGFTNLHLIRILTTTYDLYGLGLTLNITRRNPYISFRIYSRPTFFELEFKCS